MKSDNYLCVLELCFGHCFVFPFPAVLPLVQLLVINPVYEEIEKVDYLWQSKCGWCLHLGAMEKN